MGPNRQPTSRVLLEFCPCLSQILADMIEEEDYGEEETGLFLMNQTIQRTNP